MRVFDKVLRIECIVDEVLRIKRIVDLLSRSEAYHDPDAGQWNA